MVVEWWLCGTYITLYSGSVDTHILVDFASSFLCFLLNSVGLLKANYKPVCSLVESFLALCYILLHGISRSTSEVSQEKLQQKNGFTVLALVRLNSYVSQPLAQTACFECEAYSSCVEHSAK